MKKTIILYTAIISLLAFSSCDGELDYSEVTSYDKSQVFESFSRTGQFVTDIYGRMDTDLGKYDNAMLASATDESDFALTRSSIKDFYNGSWSPTNSKYEVWFYSYGTIRASNFYLESSEGQTFEGNKYDKDYSEQFNKFTRYQYEVRFLRALAFFNLVRQYGGIPLTKTVIEAKEGVQIPRNTTAEVFDFIISECDEIADKLPIDYTKLTNDAAANETGRVTKITVLALKARALLYYASPLFNENNDKELWLKAAKASKVVIDICESNGIKFGKYSDLWGTDNYKNSEMIFLRRLGDSNSIESANFPIGVEGGNSGNCPTQNLVDAYEMKSTGKLWNESGSGYDANNPYNGRDPRFYLTVAINGEKKWPAYNEKPLETFTGGLNGLPKSGATTTGYYLKKYLDNTVDLRPSSSNSKRHSYIMFRLGEFYLNYAEATFQYLNSADNKNGDLTMSAAEAVNVIRARSGVEMPALPNGLSNLDFQAKYMNERMVELAFEGHRFWDVRRWKKGELFKTIKIMEITKIGDNDFTYTRKSKERIWEDKMYFFPIPDFELRRNGALIQNPNW